MSEPTQKQSDTQSAEQARRALEETEAGNTQAADQLEQSRKADPAATEAVEQEASDGPPGLGLAR